MSRARVLAALLLGGGALYYLATRQQGQTTTTTQGGAGQGGLGQLGATLGSALAAIPGIGPLLGAGAAVGGAAMDQYRALPKDQQRQLHRSYEKVHNTFVERLGKLDPVTTVLSRTGVIANPTDKRRDKRKDAIHLLGVVREQTHGAEDFAIAQFGLLSRPDVEEWFIDQAGTTTVRFRGGNEHKLAVPWYAEHPAAWAFEATTRVLGAPTQAGRGPLTGSFKTYEAGGFSEANFHAPKRYTAGEALAWESDQLGRIASKH